MCAEYAILNCCAARRGVLVTERILERQMCLHYYDQIRPVGTTVHTSLILLVNRSDVCVWMDVTYSHETQKSVHTIKNNLNTI